MEGEAIQSSVRIDVDLYFPPTLSLGETCMLCQDAMLNILEG